MRGRGTAARRLEAGAHGEVANTVLLACTAWMAGPPESIVSPPRQLAALRITVSVERCSRLSSLFVVFFPLVADRVQFIPNCSVGLLLDRPE